MEVYARVRRAIQVDGMSQREAARQFGLARKTIRKMLAFSIPPGYGRKKPVVKPKLGPWLGIIDQILEDDKSQHKKQHGGSSQGFLGVHVRFVLRKLVIEQRPDRLDVPRVDKLFMRPGHSI